MATRLISQGPKNAKFNVKKSIVDAVPKDALFEPELTDEGILFRFVGSKKEVITKVTEPRLRWRAR